MWKWMLRFSADPNHARRHSKRASFPGGKTARFPLPALDEGDRTRAGRLLRVSGLPDQVAGNDPIDDAEHSGNQHRIGREEKPQRKRETQYPLTNRPLRQHLIDQPG